MRKQKQIIDIEESPQDDVGKCRYISDLGLAAYLLCVGCELEELDRSLKNKVVFTITGEKINEASKAYWDFNASCDPQTYFNQLKRLKNQIYSE